MLILITNDDGIYAKGIMALYQELQNLGEVIVVAPERERSAVGHAITVSDPLRVWQVERSGKFFGYAVNGTPADCVKLAVNALLEVKPDILISGINHGPNTGTNVIYSGTVSAATEGTILGIPSIAVSLDASHAENPDFSYAAKFTHKLAIKVMEKGLPKGTTLNVNIPYLPEDQIKGVAITRQGSLKFTDTFQMRTDPRNRLYYWLTSEKIEVEPNGEEEEIDHLVLRQHKISITPLQYDLTDYKLLEDLKKWNFEG
jgi:5'-nucleotidase